MTRMHKRKIVGIQVHHSALLNDAHRGLVNGVQGLNGALSCTGDPAIEELIQRGKRLIQDVGRIQGASRDRLQQFYQNDPERFKRCRDGEEPWPDETLAGFEPRCTCHDICRIHDKGHSADEGWVCKCKRCPAHPDIEREAA